MRVRVIDEEISFVSIGMASALIPASATKRGPRGPE
jgi:hypothetical protein